MKPLPIDLPEYEASKIRSFCSSIKNRITSAAEQGRMEYFVRKSDRLTKKTDEYLETKTPNLRRQSKLLRELRHTLRELAKYPQNLEVSSALMACRVNIAMLDDPESVRQATEDLMDDICKMFQTHLNKEIQ